MSAVRVGVNLLWLSPGEVGGSEDYCIGLLRAIARAAPADVDLVLYINAAIDDTYPDLRVSFATRRAPVSGRRRATRIITESTWLATQARRDRCQVVHHLGGTMPFVRLTPGIVLVHDLQPWAMPQNFSSRKRAYLRATVPPSVRGARAVTTLSQWVRQDVHERLRVPLERIACLPPGAERLAGVAVRRADNGGQTDAAILARLDIGERPFFLYPVITYAHKNHETLIRAFARVVERHPDALLVLPGGTGPAESSVRSAIGNEEIERHVRRLGRVTDEVLEALYRRTTALTFPSRYEGFGMSVLEVMQQARPVVVARSGALPEIVGDAGLVLDADDVAGWSAALDRLLDDRGEWQRLAEASRARAHQFAWETTVADLVDVYRRAAAGSLDRTDAR